MYGLVISPHQVVNKSKTMKTIINVSVKLTENMKMEQKQNLTNNTNHNVFSHISQKD